MNLAVNVSAHAATAVPVPFLRPAFATLQLIWGSIERLRSNRNQMRAIARAAGQILLALNAQDPADVDATARAELERTLVEIEAQCIRMARRRFVRAFLEAAVDHREIGLLHAQLMLCADVLQVSAQVGMEQHALRIEEARQEDQAECSAALRELLEKQDALLELIGDAPVVSSDSGAQAPQTVFRVLEGILASLRSAGGAPGRDEFEEVLAQLRKMTAPARADANPILVLLQPGLKPEVLVAPLQWRAHKLMQIDRLAIHLTREQSVQFGAAEVGSRRFIDHLVDCEDRPLQYAALDVFQQDEALKHFFKQDFVFPPSEDPNPILANLKPGVTPAALIPPLRYEIQKYAWKDILTQQLYSDQIKSFFKSGPEGCERFIKHITEGDDIALQYAVLQVFREDKGIAHYFIQEGTQG